MDFKYKLGKDWFCQLEAEYDLGQEKIQIKTKQ